MGTATSMALGFCYGGSEAKVLKCAAAGDLGKSGTKIAKYANFFAKEVKQVSKAEGTTLKVVENVAPQFEKTVHKVGESYTKHCKNETKLFSPDFIVSPGGTAFPVPSGAMGPVPVVNPSGNLRGSAFVGGKGGINGQVDTIRLMNPTSARGKCPGYKDGYIKYQNKASQGVDPCSGRTIPNKFNHYPIE